MTNKNDFEIKHGTTRIVFLIGHLAFKFPTTISWKLFLCGLLANMQERSFSGLSDKLCPVIWSTYGGWIVVMPRCKPISRKQFFKINQDWLKEPNMHLPVELKQNSFGLLYGNLVAVDYGS